jgi:hypothetical protein
VPRDDILEVEDVAQVAVLPPQTPVAKPDGSRRFCPSETDEVVRGVAPLVRGVDVALAAEAARGRDVRPESAAELAGDAGACSCINPGSADAPATVGEFGLGIESGSALQAAASIATPVRPRMSPFFIGFLIEVEVVVCWSRSVAESTLKKN